MKTMKIVVSLLLIVSLLGCMVACGGDKGPSGTYTLVEMDAGGMKMNKEQLEALGATFSITFNSDGTGELDNMVEVLEFEWEGNEMTVDGETSTFELDGDTLTFEMDGQKLVFEK